MKFFWGNKMDSFLLIKPFAFASGDDVSPLGKLPNSVVFGGGIEAQVAWNFVKYFGIAQAISARYSKDSKLYAADFFHDKKSASRNKIVGTSASEIYFLLPDTGLSLAESFIFRQLKAGAFFDYSYTGSIEYATGGFARLNISLVGLTDFIIETGGGYNFATAKPFGYFCLNNKM